MIPIGHAYHVLNPIYSTGDHLHIQEKHPKKSLQNQPAIHGAAQDMMVHEPCAITCRVAPSFLRVGHVDLFARRATAPGPMRMSLVVEYMGGSTNGPQHRWFRMDNCFRVIWVVPLYFLKFPHFTFEDVDGCGIVHIYYFVHFVILSSIAVSICASYLSILKKCVCLVGFTG